MILALARQASSSRIGIAGDAQVTATVAVGVVEVARQVATLPYLSPMQGPHGDLLWCHGAG